MQKRHLIGYPATAIIALGIGALAGSDGGATNASSIATQVTVTKAVPGPTQFATVTTGPTVRITAEPAQPKTAMAGEGIYEVGVDVRPGTYLSPPADSGNCYWARLSGPDTSEEIIDNGNSAGQVLVTIKKSDKFFMASGCNDWVRR